MTRAELRGRPLDSECRKAKTEEFSGNHYCQGRWCEDDPIFMCRHCVAFIHNCDQTYEEIMKVSANEKWFAKGRTSWDDALNEKEKKEYGNRQ